MSNGHVCCILGVCCQPPGGDTARQALAEELDKALDPARREDSRSMRRGVGRTAADWIYDNFDLVPKGLGAAIVKGYAPHFEAMAAKGKGEER